MAECPWYVSAHAVRQYMVLVHVDDFDDASDALIEYAAETWQRYVESGREPARSRDGGLLVYRGPKPLRLRLRVATTARPEGPKPQLVSVLSEHDRG